MNEPVGHYAKWNTMVTGRISAVLFQLYEVSNITKLMEAESWIVAGDLEEEEKGLVFQWA